MNAPLAYTIDELWEAGRIGRTSAFELIRTGELRAVKRGRRTLVLAEDLRRYMESLPAIEPKRDKDGILAKPPPQQPPTKGPGNEAERGNAVDAAGTAGRVRRHSSRRQL